MYVFFMTICVSCMFQFLFADSIHPAPYKIVLDKDWRLMVKQQSQHGSNGAGYVRPAGESEQDFEKRMLKSAEKGKVKSQYQLGCFYYDKQRFEEAFNWFRKAADQGMSKAQYEAGLCYLNGEGTAMNQEQAFKWFMQSAGQGNPLAEFQVGNCYKDGIGISPDIKQALSWWSAAAKHKSADAQFALGYHFYTGQDVARDYDQAFKWFSKSADANNAYAQNYMGKCSYEGNGVKKDTAKAYTWWLIAIQNGYNDAIDSRDMAEEFLSPDQVTNAKKEAQRWLLVHMQD